MSGVRVRFAPSPTGSLHLGNARTALFNYLFARQKGGIFILRVEDTDVERSQAEYEARQLADLKWLGLDWDEGPDKGGEFGPYRQSERLEIYRAYAQELIAAGRAYECFCPEEELERERKWALAHGRTPRYSGRCRDLTEEQRRRLRAQGLQPAWRFRVEPGPVEVNDLIHGRIDFRAEDIGDFVIVRHNGRPSYNFACVVDDHLMAVSHVIRGEDHLANTPRQVLIYHFFNWSAPLFAHHALLLGDDRAKLSKRHGATKVEQFRAEGILAEALVNYLAAIGGATVATDGEVMPLAEIGARWELNRTGRAGAVFDYHKLNWFNTQHLRSLPLEYLAELLDSWWKAHSNDRGTEGRLWSDLWVEENRERIKDCLAICRGNASGLKDLTDWVAVLVGGADLWPANVIVALQANPEEARTVLEAARSLSAEPGWLSRLGEATGLKGRRLYHPLRLALTGREQGPQLTDLIDYLGPAEVRRRLDQALSFLPA